MDPDEPRRPGWRRITQMDNGRWVVYCKACRKGRSQRKFDTERDCFRYWERHKLTPLHIKATDPVRIAERDEAERVLREMYGFGSETFIALSKRKPDPTPE